MKNGKIIWTVNGKEIASLLNGHLCILDQVEFDAQRKMAVYDDSYNQDTWRSWFPKDVNGISNPHLTNTIVDILNGVYEEKKRRDAKDREDFVKLVESYKNK